MITMEKQQHPVAQRIDSKIPEVVGSPISEVQNSDVRCGQL
jgi:hypothetical protein